MNSYENGNGGRRRPRGGRLPKEYCPMCDCYYTKINRNRHKETNKHKENDPTRTMPVVRRRGRPKTVRLHKEIKFHKDLFEGPVVRQIMDHKETSFEKRLETLVITNNRNFLDIQQFLNAVKPTVFGGIYHARILPRELPVPANMTHKQYCRIIRQYQYDHPQQYRNLKVHYNLPVEMIKVREGVAPRNDNQNQAVIGTIETHYFQTENESILPTTNMDEYYADVVVEFMTRLKEFEIRDSGWSIHRIINLEVAIKRYEPKNRNTCCIASNIM